MDLKGRYEESFKYWSDANDGGWQDWFDPNLPSELAFPTDIEFSADVVTEMLEAGETSWHHPGWIRDLWELLREWTSDGLLIRVRLFSQWLLSTIPSEPMDTEICDRLHLLAEGRFCEVFEGECSIVC